MTVPTSTTKSSWSTQCTRSSDETPTRTGSPNQSTNTENSKVSPAPAKNPEVSEKVTDSPKPLVVPDTRPGSDETPSNFTEKDRLDVDIFSKFSILSKFIYSFVHHVCLIK